MTWMTNNPHRQSQSCSRRQHRCQVYTIHVILFALAKQIYQKANNLQTKMVIINTHNRG